MRFALFALWYLASPEHRSHMTNVDERSPTDWCRSLVRRVKLHKTSRINTLYDCQRICGKYFLHWSSSVVRLVRSQLVSSMPYFHCLVSLNKSSGKGRWNLQRPPGSRTCSWSCRCCSLVLSLSRWRCSSKNLQDEKMSRWKMKTLSDVRDYRRNLFERVYSTFHLTSSLTTISSLKLTETTVLFLTLTGTRILLLFKDI